MAETAGRAAAPSVRRGAPRRRGGQLLASAAAIALSLGLLVAGSGLDRYLNRGIVWGIPPRDQAVPASGGLTLGANVFLEKEPDREKVATTVRMLREARIDFVRQTFSWAEIEPAPGSFVDPNTGRSSWEKYDYLVDQLHEAGIGILARVDTIPRWARSPDDDFETWDKAPPQDFDNYANFATALAARYRGKVGHIQVWNEPNLQGEWGGRPISPEQYGLLLKYTYPKVKAANPSALVVTAGLAPTTQRGPENLSELLFIQGLYDSGAGGAFDILSVMAYGIGDSPEDRRADPERTNFSRLILVREVMERNGDAAKPIWVSEYGWISVPPEKLAEYNGYWGESVPEETQARYLVAGLERAEREWPWLGAVFVWAFRWVESPEDPRVIPARYFEIVDHDFRPRPAYLALSDWAHRPTVATAGSLGSRDARLEYQGAWRDQEVGGQQYRVAERPGATVRLAFHGTELRLRARTGPRVGRVYATLDGQPVPGLPSDEDGSYVSLRNSSSVVDADLPLASGLADEEHTLELRAADDTFALSGLAVGRQRPFAWATPLHFAAGLTGLFAGILAALRTGAGLAGWLPATRPAPRRRGLAWWDTRE